MKKVLKVLAIALVAVMVVFVLTQPVAFAANNSANILNGVNTDSNVGASDMQTIGSKVMSFIWVLSIIVAVIVLMYTGLKFIVGSASEKAEYKKSLMPLVVGVLILVFATTIIRALFGFGS